MLKVSPATQHSDSTAHIIFLTGPVITTVLLQQQEFCVYNQDLFTINCYAYSFRLNFLQLDFMHLDMLRNTFLRTMTW